MQTTELLKRVRGQTTFASRLTMFNKPSVTAGVLSAESYASTQHDNSLVPIMTAQPELFLIAFSGMDVPISKDGSTGSDEEAHSSRTAFARTKEAEVIEGFDAGGSFSDDAR